MLLDLLVVFRTRKTVGTREPFHVAHVKLAEFIKAYGLGLATLVTSEEVKEEPPAVVDREGTTTIKALGLNLMSHYEVDSSYDPTEFAASIWAPTRMESEANI